MQLLTMSENVKLSNFFRSIVTELLLLCASSFTSSQWLSDKLALNPDIMGIYF